MNAPLHRPYRRRVILQTAVAGGAGAILAACGEELAPTATVAPATRAATTTAAAPAATTAPTAAMTAATVAPTTGMAAAATTAPTAAATTALTTAAPAATIVPTRAPMPAANTQPMVDGLVRSTVIGVPDLYTKNVPSFRATMALPGRMSKVTSLHVNYGNPPVPPRNENRYWQELEKQLGVTLEPNIVPVGNYREKLAALTAGGEIPDISLLVLDQAPDQNKVIAQGGYTDLTPLLTGAGLSEFPYLAAFPDYMWKNITIKGKLYGVPRPTTLVGSTLVFRQDWADKLGFPQPKNAEEFFQLAVAMTKNDPDGNGQQDTWALGSGGSGTFSSQFFQNMFRVPNRWRLNADGTLTAAIETEEYRQSVAYMKRLFDAGVFHPDTATMNTQQAKAFFGGGKIGAYVDGTGGVSDFRPRGRFALPGNANADGLVPMGHDGGKAVTYKGTGVIGFNAIPTKVGRDRERAKELLRLLNWWASPFGSEEQVFIDFGLPDIHHTVKPDGTRERNMRGSLERGDLSNLTDHPPVITAIGETMDEGRRQQKLLNGLTALGIDNPTQNAFSATFATKAGELDQLERDRLVSIITGREPLTALDTFVKDWRARGGDQIRKEYEADLKG